MKPIYDEGQIVTWKDDRGFGFIKSNNDSKEVFLHISALPGKVRRPRIGDTILYKKVIESDGRIRAVEASIRGVAPRLSPKRKSQKKALIPTFVDIFVDIVIKGSIALFVIKLVSQEYSPSRLSSLITSITKPTIAKPECIVKGNISHNGGRRLYHLPGM